MSDNANSRKLIENLQRELDITIHNIEIMRVLDTYKDGKTRMRELERKKENGELQKEQIDIGTLKYGYALKEYIELQLKVHFDKRDLTDAEYQFVESYDSIIKTLDAQRNVKTAQTYIDVYIEKKYKREIENWIYADLETVKEILCRRIEEFEKHKKSSKESDTPKENIFDSINKIFLFDLSKSRILYSVQMKMIEYDINNTKNANTKITKTGWYEAWKRTIINKLDIRFSSYFYNNEEVLLSELKKNIKGSDDKSWIKLLLLQCVLFEAYQPLSNNKEENKKLKGLKIKADYIKDVLCSKEGIFTPEEVKYAKAAYTRNLNKLMNKNQKTIVALTSTVILTIVSGGTALVFAPEIAVLAVGGSFALSGAALTNASLALIGGGALAVGGMGMAGGTAVIAGGGFLVGAVTSGSMSAVAAMSMLSVKDFGLQTSAMLLAFCDILNKYDLISKYNYNLIVTLVKRNISEFSLALDQMERNFEKKEKLLKAKKTHNKKEDKEEIKHLKKHIDTIQENIKYMKKCELILEKKQKNN